LPDILNVLTDQPNAERRLTGHVINLLFGVLIS